MTKPPDLPLADSMSARFSRSPKQLGPLTSVAEAARLLHFNRGSCNRFAREGRFEAVLNGRKYFFTAAGMTAFRKYATEHPDRHGFHRRPRKTTPSTPPPQNGSGSGSTSSPEPLAPPPARETLDLSLKLFERTLEKVIRHALSEQTIHLHSIGQQLVRMHLALLRELFIPDLVQPAPGGERTSPPPAPQGPAPPESEVGF